jgi:hypothetical protein
MAIMTVVIVANVLVFVIVDSSNSCNFRVRADGHSGRRIGMVQCLWNLFFVLVTDESAAQRITL